MVIMTTIRIYRFLFLFGFLGDIRHNTRKEMNQAVEDFATKITSTVENLKAVSYTHLTLPTNREV